MLTQGAHEREKRSIWLLGAVAIGDNRQKRRYKQGNAALPRCRFPPRSGEPRHDANACPGADRVHLRSHSCAGGRRACDSGLRKRRAAALQNEVPRLSRRRQAEGRPRHAQQGRHAQGGRERPRPHAWRRTEKPDLGEGHQRQDASRQAEALGRGKSPHSQVDR